MSYLTDMDKHAPALRQMQKLRVRTVLKRSDNSMEYTYKRAEPGYGWKRMLPAIGDRWLLALQFVEGAAAHYDEYRRMSVFTLNHDRIRAALVHYDEAAAAMEVR